MDGVFSTGKQSRSDMRQGQNQKRSRGRGRKPQNPLSRSMESNGPDVKIRGTASHIYEKYQALARDAQSSGDRIASESYFQHAEHYHRLIVAAQAQQEQTRQENPNRQENQGRDNQGRDGQGRGGNGQADGDESEIADGEGQATAKPASEEVAAENDGEDGDGEEKPAPRRRAPRRRRAPAKARSDSNSDGGDDKPASEDVSA